MTDLWLRDQRLAPLAVSAFPAWLWSIDAARILWANPTGAAMFGTDPATALAARKVDPGEPAALQVAELAASLKLGDAPRIERLRGFGSGVGRGLTCACSQFKLDDGTAAILVVAAERAGPELSLAERVHRLLAGTTAAMAAFAADGALIEATGATRERLQGKTSLAALGADQMVAEALTAGHAVGESGEGPIELRRIGAEAQPVLIATFRAARAPHEPPAEALVPTTAAPAPVRTTPAIPGERRHPLRFVWQMDAEGRFTLGSEEFIALIGPQTARHLDQPWTDMSTSLQLDPEDHVVQAVATHDTWSGLTVSWPVDESPQRLTVELSGLPIFDRDRVFRGYRGFGVCRDVAALNALASLRRNPNPAPPQAPAKSEAAGAPLPAPAELRAENIVPFRSPPPPLPPEAPSLTPVERRAFRELTRRLTSRLTEAGVEYAGASDQELPNDRKFDPTLGDLNDAATAAATLLTKDPEAPPPSLDEEIFQPQPPHRAPSHEPLPLPSTATPIPILDRLPIGLLIYRHSELLYANRAFLASTGYANLDALSEAGGLDSLFIGPDALAPGAAGGGKPFALAGQGGDQVAVEGRLIVVPWEGDSAFALVTTPVAARVQQAAPAQDEAAELRAILDTATDGVIVLDRDGRILSASRSSEALFGYEALELIGRFFASLFAPESERIASDYLDRLKKNGVASVLNDGCEVIGRVRQGGLIPLFMTLGCVDEHTQKFCAVVRDLTPWKKAEEELIESKRRSEKTSAVKADFLAKVSHEIRTPLNAIIGFSEVMLEERFGPIGNERYREYLQDIHASGGQVIALLDDLLALSRIDAGTLDLAFTSVALNELIQQCVAAMQPQANKERVIIRTSLPPKLPPVMADESALRQIVTNLLSHSIKLSAAGGQIIVSTALTDAGEVALRVRDTGIGMSETEIANALEPFRSLAVSGRWGATGLGLPLSKALTEANRASFAIRSKPKEGTLVEVVFPAARVIL